MNQRYLAFQFIHPDFDSTDNRDGLVLNKDNSIGSVYGSASIRQSILMLLSTRPGERVMRPNYGSYLYRLVFAQNDNTTAGLAIHYIQESLSKWEPRITIIKLDASPATNDTGRLDITLDYQEKATQVQERLLLSLDLMGGNT